MASKKIVQVKTPQRFQGKRVSFSQAVAGAKLFIRSTAERYRILSMSSDFPGFAWGGVFHLPKGNLEVRDHWSVEEAALHISTKEMLALLRVLQSSPAGLRNCRVDVNVDSQVLLDTWSRAGSKSPQLTVATKEVYHLVSERNIQLTLYKVPSKGNITHLPSRHLLHSDCKLSLQSRKRIQKAFRRETDHTLDLMALDSNAQPDFEGPPLTHFTRLSARLNPRESICLHKILSMEEEEQPLRFSPLQYYGTNS